MTKSQIHLIRHGITEGNQKRLYYGGADIPLADEGIQDLENLVREKIYPTIKKAEFYTSGMVRTEQTFQLIFGEQKHKQIEELREMRFGDFEMKSYHDLKEVPAYQTWISDKSGTLASPGGESIYSFNQRIQEGFRILMEYHSETEARAQDRGEDAASVVVCHGGVISAIMMEQFPHEEENFYQWIPDPGHGYTLFLQQGKTISYEKF